MFNASIQLFQNSDTRESLRNDTQTTRKGGMCRTAMTANNASDYHIDSYLAI